MIEKIPIIKPKAKWKRIKLDKKSMIKFSITSIASIYYPALAITSLTHLIDIASIEEADSKEKVYILLNHVNKYFLIIIINKFRDKNKSKEVIEKLESIFDDLVNEKKLFLEYKGFQDGKIYIENISFYKDYYNQLTILLSIYKENSLSKEDFYNIIKDLLYSEWARNSNFYNTINSLLNIPFVKQDIDQSDTPAVEKILDIVENIDNKINKYDQYHKVSTKESINLLINHTKSNLSSSNYFISYNSKKIEINNIKIDEVFNNSNLIIYGEGGVGKTSLIKKIYENSNVPIFIFNTDELNVKNINELFSVYGDFNLIRFKEFYKDINNKYIVIDSAEKLSEIKNLNPFKELIRSLGNDNWRFIFTSRVEYLESIEFILNDLKFSYEKKKIDNISIEELEEISKKYSFILPKSKKLKELLSVPFYLNEYLGLKENDISDIKEFRELLWNKKIKNNVFSSHNNINIKREEAFIQLSLERANEFFIKINDKYNQDAVNGLIEDGVIRKYKGNYLINHDIYEEWGLVKYIESVYSRSLGSFFEDLGNSLAIKRNFRVWLKDNTKKAEYIFEGILIEDNISQSWKDEVITSLLEIEGFYDFLGSFQTEILENDNEILKRIIHLIKTTCKKPDYYRMKLFNSYNSFFYIPIGNSWKDIIKFILEYKHDINVKMITDIIELSKDWIKNNSKGETTRNIGLISLYYLKTCKNNKDNIELSKIILKSSLEIKEELSNIFEELLGMKRSEIRSSNYNKLIHFMINKLLDSGKITKALPNYVIKFMDKMWIKEKKKEFEVYGYTIQRSGRSQEELYGLVDDFYTNLSPASALQTSMFALLRIIPEKTIDFIIEFTNNRLSDYKNNTLNKKGNIFTEIKLNIDEMVIEQYMSSTLWYMYRQGGPDLLSSIHMALEKYLLEFGRDATSDELETLCKNILLKSKSASISSVINSVVLAYPEKLFNIAIILLQVKEFILYDVERWKHDYYKLGKMLYSIGNRYDKRMFQEERVKTYDDEFRKRSFISVIFQYQIPQKGDFKDSYAIKSKAIWDVFDTHFNKLDKKYLQWEEYLLSMDIRKQKLKYTKIENGLIIQGEPDLPEEIENEKKEKSKISNNLNLYSELVTWGLKSLDNESYTSIYNENPRLAFDKLMEIYNNRENENKYPTTIEDIQSTIIPLFIRDYFDLLLDDEKQFCFNFIINSVDKVLKSEFEFTIYKKDYILIILPTLLERFSDKIQEIKEVILRVFLFEYNYENKLTLAKEVSRKLWIINYDFAKSLFLGVFKLTSDKENIVTTFCKDRGIERKNLKYCEDALKELNEIKFYDTTIIKKILNSEFNDNLINFNLVSINNLIIHYSMLPENFEDHSITLDLIGCIIVKSNIKTPFKSNLTLNRNFNELFSSRLLQISDKELSKEILKIVSNSINIEKNGSSFILHLLDTQEKLKEYDNFWYIWNNIYSLMIKNSDFSTKETNYNRFLSYYLFDINDNPNTKEYYSIRYQNKSFFQRIVKELGNNEVVFYSYCKNLNTIFSIFEDDGIFWLESMIKTDMIINQPKLMKDSVWYLEKFIASYVKENPDKIKKEKDRKKAVIVILDFLVDNKSSVAYSIRENL